MIKPKVKEYLRVHNADIIGNQSMELILGTSPSTAHKIEGDKSVLTLLKLCDGEKTVKEIHNLMKNEYRLSEIDINRSLETLKKEGILEDGNLFSDFLTEEEMERYARHFVYYSTFTNENRYLPQEKLKNTKVTLIGMGGIGNWVSLNLAAAGVGHIKGVDHDHVELSNLTRQILFSENDIGKKKVKQAKERLESLNSNINFEAISRKMDSVESVKKVIEDTDMVILSADSPEHIHYWVDQACYELKIPWTNVGYVDSWGVSGPIVIPDETSCLICDMKTRDVKEDRLSKNLDIVSINKRMHAPSFGPLNGLVSCMTAMEVIKYITRYEEPITIEKRWTINSGTMEVEMINYPRDPKCIQCGN